jgi:hypothetical protein
MELPKTKAISRIEGKMETLDEQSLRYETLQSARQFKTSWIELGQYLQTIWRERHFKSWGYTSFESYCTKEIAVKHTTALKLLRSYYFLEREEPSFLKTKLHSSDKVVALPSVDSVNILRLAKDKKGLEGEDYKALRYRVLDKGEEPKEVRSKLRSILDSYAEVSPEDEQRKKHTITINRFLGTLRNLRKEIECSNIVSKKRVREIDQLIANIEEEILG